MRDPNFMLIGAQKAGTSWLDAMMRQHPDIFLPQTKELHHFNLVERYKQGIDAYRQHFASCNGHKAVGECTPAYLWVNDGPPEANHGIRFHDYPIVNRNIDELIHRQYPDLKLIVCLRNPVERAVSSYLHAIRDRKISPRRRILDAAGEQGIAGMGFYASHLRQWMTRFPRERFLILIYEHDIADNKPHTLRRVFEHLGVDTDFEPKQSQNVYNERSSDLYMYLNWYFPRLTPRALKRYRFLRKLPFPRITVTADERAQLRHVYEQDIADLEQLLGRSLDVWRTTSS